jgi:hypothetical protein
MEFIQTRCPIRLYARLREGESSNRLSPFLSIACPHSYRLLNQGFTYHGFSGGVQSRNYAARRWEFSMAGSCATPRGILARCAAVRLPRAAKRIEKLCWRN